MQIKKIISLHSGDAATLLMVEEIYGLINGHDLPEEAQKPFGRIRGNAFTLEDVHAIGALVEQALAAPDPDMFADPKLQKTYVDGRHANLALARRQYRSFLDRLNDDIAACEAAQAVAAERAEAAR